MPKKRSKKNSQPLHPDFEFIQQVKDIFEYRLRSNGLRVLLYPRTDVEGVVGTMVTYHVGSRNEVNGYTGATHLLEHLLFKESEKFQRKDKRSILDLLEKRGADVNASTSFDRTDYYCLVPTHLLPTALDIESDRMRNALIKQEHYDSEMPVVQSELEWRDNNPYVSLYHAMHMTAFVSHPYRHPVIGWRSDIENITIERLKWFYNEYYYPDNATLTIVGDIAIEQALLEVTKYFKQVPKKEGDYMLPFTKEEDQLGTRHVTINRSGENIVGILYKIPGALHEDIPALLMLGIILSSLRTGRLQKAFIDTGLATKVDASPSQYALIGVFEFFVSLTKKLTHDDALKRLLAVIELVKKSGVTEGELRIAKKLVRKVGATRLDTVWGILDTISEEVSRGDWTRFYSRHDALMNVTKGDILRVARKYFIAEQSTTGFYVTPS